MGVCQPNAGCCRTLSAHRLHTTSTVIQELRPMTVLKMTDLDLQGKRVLIREDLNVPVKDGVVTSDARILASLPTIKLALEKGAAFMVCSHLGRPTEGEFSAENSLKPVADYLSKALGRDVPLVADYLNGVEVDRKSTRLNSSHANISY